MAPKDNFHKWKSASKMSWLPLHGAVNLSMGFLCLLFLSNLAASTKGENKKEDRIAVLATAEVPAKSVDLAAINLTELVNGMLNTALKGTRKLFSLLSITSYSSYAFHKVSIVIYNISNLKNIDPSKFPMRYCYCLNNRTNDLTDFTALLVDIVENSTSYLKEIFKSTSIVSVSQSNDTDCIYICVMSGRTGRNLSDLWEAIEKSPVINYTFSGNMSNFLGLDLPASGLIPLQEDPVKVWGDTAKDMWALKATKKPTWAQAGTLRREEILLTQEPITLKMVTLKTSEASSVQTPFWFQTNASRGDEISSAQAASTDPLSLLRTSSVKPLELQPAFTPKMPLQTWSMVVKDKETLSAHFTIWQRTVGSKGSEESSFQTPLRLQTVGPQEWGGSPTEQPVFPTPLRDAILSGTKTASTTGVPLPLTSLSTEEGQNVLKTHPPSSETYTFLTQPVSSQITKAPRPTQIGKVPFPALPIPAQRPGVLQKVNSRCPQGIKKGFSPTTPALTLQKINPCVMELCRFYQQCLCTRNRSYSRNNAMRYCLENYSWFLKNAIYICERVKRTAYSKTLKQKCLASICRSI